MVGKSLEIPISYRENSHIDIAVIPSHNKKDGLFDVMILIDRHAACPFLLKLDERSVQYIVQALLG